jgi:hypothetical protein
MAEVKEPCGRCKHPLSAHTRNVREEARQRAGILSVDPALLKPKQYDWRSDRPAGESGCTECSCSAWEPAGEIHEGAPVGPPAVAPSAPGEIRNWNHPDKE